MLRSALGPSAITWPRLDEADTPQKGLSGGERSRYRGVCGPFRTAVLVVVGGGSFGCFGAANCRISGLRLGPSLRHTTFNQATNKIEMRKIDQ